MIGVLALDPGATRTGAAYVELDALGWFHIRFGGHVENGGSQLDGWLLAACSAGAAVAIEEIVGEVYKGRTGAHLMEASKAEGAQVAAAQRYRCKNLLRIPARDWRAELCHSKGASDAQIRIAVEGSCKTIPLISAEAREHVYDAAGLAMVALARITGRTLRLLPAVEAAIHLQREKEMAKRAERAAAPKEKRTLSRRQRERKSESAKRSWAERRT